MTIGEFATAIFWGIGAALPCVPHFVAGSVDNEGDIKPVIILTGMALQVGICVACYMAGTHA